MEKQRFHSWFALFAVIGLCSYQLLLCFVNTHFITINNGMVAAVEGSILGLTCFKIFRHRNLTEFAVPAMVVAYFILMWVLRGEIDPQGMRNVLIIYAMFSLGRMTSDLRDVNRIMWVLAAIVAIIGFFEYFLIDAYLTTFNILKYYTARGLVSDEQLGYLNTNLYISGMRPSGRTLLPFIGDQRISSIFLEPVSMGNYAAIVCMWALSFDVKDWRKSIGHYIAGALFIIACDSRFASLIVIILFVIRFVPLAQKPWVLYPLPIIVALAQSFFASLRLVDAQFDDMPGRLAKAGDGLLQMQLPELFGLGSTDAYLDMGIPYSLVVFGILLCAFMWIRLVFMRFDTSQGMRMRAMLTIYCLGLLLISGTSFYASKTAGLLWLILGTLYEQNRQPSAAIPVADPLAVSSEPPEQTATDL